jgi:hypothetical protein
MSWSSPREVRRRSSGGMDSRAWCSDAPKAVSLGLVDEGCWGASWGESFPEAAEESCGADAGCSAFKLLGCGGGADLAFKGCKLPEVAGELVACGEADVGVWVSDMVNESFYEFLLGERLSPQGEVCSLTVEEAVESCASGDFACVDSGVSGTLSRVGGFHGMTSLRSRRACLVNARNSAGVGGFFS